MAVLKQRNIAQLTWLIIFNGIHIKKGAVLQVLCQTMGGLNNMYFSFLRDSYYFLFSLEDCAACSAIQSINMENQRYCTIFYSGFFLITRERI